VATVFTAMPKSLFKFILM